MVASFVNWSLNGISDAGNYPPQNALAVGPSYVVTAESSELEWTNLSTGVTSAPLSFYSSALFGSTGVTSIYDARLAYDSSTGYYVLSAVVLNSDGSYGLDFAVATNPNATWTVANLPVSPSVAGSPSSPDMPDISVGGGKIYVTTAQVSTGLVGTAQWVVPESSVAAGGSITGLTASVDPGANGIMRPVTGLSGSTYTTYYFGAYSNGSQVELSYQTYDATNGFSAVQTLSPGNASIGNSGGNFAAPQNGTTLQLDALDSRIQSLAYGTINGKNYVFGVSEVQASSTSQPAVEWFQYDVSNPSSPVLAGHGEITGSSTGLGAGVAIFNPSIAVNASGDVLINFTASSSTTFPSDYYVVAGPALIFGAPTLYHASTSFFESSATATGLQRWGTYSSAVADPNNPDGFWISNEYVSNDPNLVNIPTGSGVNAWWGTTTAQVIVATPPRVAGVGDFNGDGMADVLWRNTNGALYDWTMNGSRIVSSQPITYQGAAVILDASWSVAGVADFNGDGMADVLWRNTNGALYDWTMNGSQIGSSQPITYQGAAVILDASWSVAGVADFNGD
uniref:FG-GAP repeat domain-containing protein n=1 Tax=Rhodoblastus sp. TaxID=1962975 RepID=UPI0025ED4454